MTSVMTSYESLSVFSVFSVRETSVRENSVRYLRSRLKPRLQLLRVRNFLRIPKLLDDTIVSRDGLVVLIELLVSKCFFEKIGRSEIFIRLIVRSFVIRSSSFLELVLFHICIAEQAVSAC